MYRLDIKEQSSYNMCYQGYTILQICAMCYLQNSTSVISYSSQKAIYHLSTEFLLKVTAL